MNSNKSASKTKKSRTSRTSKSKGGKKATKEVDLGAYSFNAISGFASSKIFDCLLLYGIENCDRLRDFNDDDTFPLERYYDLKGKIEHTRGNGEKKKTPFNTGRHGKIIIQYLCSRFVWEVTQIDMDTFDVNNIPKFILDGVSNMKNNVSELIIHTIERVPISNLIKKSHGLEQEMMTKIGTHIDDIDLTFYIAKTLVRFIKYLAFQFSNEFWYNNAKTIGERNFRAVLAGCESYLPVKTKTLKAGLMTELNSYVKDNITDAKKKEKKKESKDADESDEGEDEDDVKSDDEENEDANESDGSNKSRSKKKKKKKKKASSDNDDDEEDEGDGFEYEEHDE